MHQPVYTNMYMPYIEGPKWTGQSMMHYTTASLNGGLKCKNILDVSSQPSQNAKSARKLFVDVGFSFCFV